MGYFSYFVKCLIRRFVYIICKPKIAFIIFISTFVFFGLRYYGYCAEWTDQDISSVLDGFATITNNQGVIITQLGNIGVDVTDLQNSLNSIKGDISQIETNTSNIATVLANIYLRLNTLNNSILSLMNTVNSNHEETISKLEENNKKILEELSLLRDSLLGSESSESSYEDKGIYNVNIGGTVWNGVKVFKIPVQYGFTYSIDVEYTAGNVSGVFCSYIFYDKLITNTFETIPYTIKWVGSVNQNSVNTFTITTRDTENVYLYLTWGSKITNISVTSSNQGIIDSLDQTNQSINDVNSSINDSNINVDSSLPTNDTNDITESGFNSIFSTLYNAFTQKNSQDIVLTIPFTNKSFIINYNTVFGSFTFGIIGYIINAFWYFFICLYIVNDIEKKIYKIKSGNIEDIETGNIKGDLL